MGPIGNSIFWCITIWGFCTNPSTKSRLAEKHFLYTLKLEPRYPPAYTQLGILELERHNDVNALKYFQKALAHEVNSKQERNYAGLVLIRQKRLNEAINQFQNSLRANPEDTEYILTHLGVAYKYKGERDKAIRYFREVIKINPNHVPAQLHLMECRLLDGEGNMADQMADRLINLFTNDHIDLLIEEMVLQKDILIEHPNIKIIGPALEKALKNKGNYYSDLALKLKNFRNR
jgi:tetratricopeptide (TPR) repeat protein